MTPSKNLTPAQLELLLRQLPEETPARTRIVRIDGEGHATITVRDDDGASPLAYGVEQGLGAGRLVPLRPEEDDALPGSRLLRDPRELARRLGRAASTASVSVVAYRPRRRLVARLTLGSGPPLFLKLLTKKGHRRARRVLGALPEGTPGVRLVLPERWLDEERIAATPEARGTSLHETLERGVRFDVALLVEGLRRLRGLPASGELPLRTPESERASTLVMLERGARLRPELGELAGRVRDVVLPDAGPPALLHADLHDKQIFLGEEGLELIDLEGCSRGDPRLDWVNLLEHLRLRDYQRERDPSRSIRVDLTRRLGLDLDDPLVRALSGLVRARLAGVYALRPRWWALVSRLAADATRALE